MEDSANGPRGQHAIEHAEMALEQELEHVQIRCHHIMAAIVPEVMQRLCRAQWFIAQ
jgi:hypothetical protein